MELVLDRAHLLVTGLLLRITNVLIVLPVALIVNAVRKIKGRRPS